jgi:hypothetical protein
MPSHQAGAVFRASPAPPFAGRVALTPGPRFLRRRGRTALKGIRAREYLERTLAAQDTARERINGYLALSVADTLLLSWAQWLPRGKEQRRKGPSA